MVASYHIWFHRVSGGVDIFFVVAGYFAAGSMLRIAEESSGASALSGVSRYWLRTLRRVVPSASLVVLVTSAMGVALLPGSQQRSAYTHGIASLFSVENWYLISVGNDYLQEGLFVSPFQQFWALSIQVQSYLVVGLVTLLVVFASGKWGVPHRRMLLYVSGTIFVSSLAFSVYLTAFDQPRAYFDLSSRIWEFMAGAILALVLGGTRQNPRLMGAVGWGGLVLALGFAAVVDPSPLLPGLTALVPVSAGAAVIASSRAGVEPWILKSAPMLWFAESSFAFYLWHWPLLVFYRLLISINVSFVGGVAILVLSAILAVLTTRLVEQPIRRSPRLQRSAVATLLVSALLMAPAAAVLTTWRAKNQAWAARDWASVHAVLDGGPRPDAGFVPSTMIAWRDFSKAYARDCVRSPGRASVRQCRWGDKDSPLTVVLVGASHDAQWVEPVATAANDVGAKVVTMLKSRCPFGDAANADIELSESCVRWNQDVLSRLLTEPPDLVVTMGTRWGDLTEDTIRWQWPYLERLSEAGIPVLGIRDNPRFPFHVPLCVDRKGPGSCTMFRSEAYLPAYMLDLPTFPGYRFVDMADEYCPDGICPAVMDGILVYRDSNHLTTTWTKLHAARIQEAVKEILS